MRKKIPDISNQIYKKDTLSTLENKYSTMGPMWVTHQMEWLSGVYASFKDHDKFLIIIFLTKKTLDFYSRNFIKLTYDEFYSKATIEIEKYTIIEISKALHIPKESTRRKVSELEKEGAIRKLKKKTIIDRSKFYHSKPVDSIKRVSRFLAALSSMCLHEKVLLKGITSQQLELIIKANFSYIWKIYYEIQIPMMVEYKKIFEDLETFHIFGTCVVNEHLFAKKISKDYMDRDDFVNSFFAANEMQGINAMSISDITGIPRATVIRKLKNLIKKNMLSIDTKKHYRLTRHFIKEFMMPTQAGILTKVADFSAHIFNLILLDAKP